jgi:hypothetical protein
MHIAVRLCDPSIRIFDDIDDTDGQALGYAVIGGPRATFYVRDISRPIITIGAQIDPLAARFVFGMPAAELSDRHTRLDDVWRLSVDSLRAQIIEAKSLELRLHALEQARLTQLRNARRVHPAIAHALDRLSPAG